VEQHRGGHVAFAVLSAALFGLFAMHGWGLHGSSHEAASMHADAGACIGHPMEHCQPDPVPTEDHGLMGLCLAILGGIAAVALALLGGRTLRLTAVVPRHNFASVPRWFRERDPPDLLALGVIRC
jgi:hypothetical protein